MELQQKTAVYQSMRGMRAPVEMEKHVEQREPRVSEKNTNWSQKASTPGKQRQELDPKVPSFGQVAQASSTHEFSPTVGRVPVDLAQDMQFAGVSDGQSLWALPNTSPEAREMMGFSGQVVENSIPAGLPHDDLMADIDWVNKMEPDQSLFSC